MEPVDGTPETPADVLRSTAGETGQVPPGPVYSVEGGPWPFTPAPGGFIVVGPAYAHGGAGGSGAGGGAAVGNVGGSGIKRMIDGRWYLSLDGGRTYTRED